jgi:hypothetical protein
MKPCLYSSLAVFIISYSITGAGVGHIQEIEVIFLEECSSGISYASKTR